jgi:hypothetical protein
MLKDEIIKKNMPNQNNWGSNHVGKKNKRG